MELKMRDEMNCCGCKKELDINTPCEDGKAQVYGKYRNQNLVKAICNDCIKDPVKKEAYKNDG